MRKGVDKFRFWKGGQTPPEDLVDLDIATLLELLETFPGDLNLRVKTAAELLRNGDFNQAEIQLDACLSDNPGEKQNRLMLAVLRQRIRHLKSMRA
jgi:hypothetical protein